MVASTCHISWLQGRQSDSIIMVNADWLRSFYPPSFRKPGGGRTSGTSDETRFGAVNAGICIICISSTHCSVRKLLHVLLCVSAKLRTGDDCSRVRYMQTGRVGIYRHGADYPSASRPLYVIANGRHLPADDPTRRAEGTNIPHGLEQDNHRPRHVERTISPADRSSRLP